MKLRLLLHSFLLVWTLPSISHAQEAITGQVVSSQTGKFIEHAVVSLIRVNDPRHPVLTADAPFSQPVDRTDGTFYFSRERVESVQARVILLVARSKGFGFEAKRLRKTNHSGHYVLELHPQATISGTVRNSDGVPIAGALVGIVYDDPVLRNSSASPPWWYRGVFTDGEGHFTTHTSPGLSFVVEASHNDYLYAFSRPMRVPHGGKAPTTVELRLDPGIEVSGRVIDDQGRACSGVNLELVSRAVPPYQQSRAFSNSLYLQAKTAVDGTFIFRGAFQGAKELVIVGERRAPLSRIPLQLDSSRKNLVIRMP